MKYFLVLILASFSFNSFANYDDDISVVEACEIELSKNFSSDQVSELLFVASEAVQIDSNTWQLDMDTVHCYVKYTDGGTVDSVMLYYDEE